MREEDRGRELQSTECSAAALILHTGLGAMKKATRRHQRGDGEKYLGVPCKKSRVSGVTQLLGKKKNNKAKSSQRPLAEILNTFFSHKDESSSL